MKLPHNHPQRVELNDEVHARPHEAMKAPMSVSYLALSSAPAMSERDIEPLADLARRYDVTPPTPGANHFSADFGPFRLKWERHTEFYRYMFIAPAESDTPFDDPVLDRLPADWVSSLPGELLVAAHAALVPGGETALEYEAISTKLFAGNPLIGAIVADLSGTALTDFRIQADGFSRFLVEDRGMTRRQAGRMVQRLMEIDTYRILALLALPVARKLTPFLAESEAELARITAAMPEAAEQDDPLLLDRLTKLEAAVESRQADAHYRFSAAAAYYDLVRRRIAELREERIPGLQTFEEFTERRLAPAMSTCVAASDRLESLSERVARATQLLSTRVDITTERQNQAVLESMNRRAKLQLRLQQTVEGLSVAAITYYIVGLVGYATKGLQGLGITVKAEIVMAVSIPIVAFLVWMGVRKVRKTVDNRAD